MSQKLSPLTTQWAARLGGPLTALSAVLLLAAPAPAVAAAPATTEVGVRVGEHPGFARIVFDLSTGASPKVTIRPGHVSVQFPPGTLVTPPDWMASGSMPAHVLSFTVTNGRAEISVDPGAEIKPAAPDGRLVLDILTPHGAAAPAKPATRSAAADHAHARTERHRPAPSSATRAPPTPTPPTQAPPATAAKAGPPPASPAAAAIKAPGPAASPPATGLAALPPAAGPAASPPAAMLPPAAAPGPMAANPSPAPPTPPAGASGRADAAPPSGSVAPVTESPLPPPAPAVSASPVSLRATKLAATPDGGVAGFAVPFDQHVAAAAFRRGGYAYIVFDQARPLDLAGLRGDPVLGDATVSVLPAGTVIRLPLAAGRGIALAPSAERWTVRLTPLAVPLRPTAPRLADGRLLFSLDAPGAVVAVPDPDTGTLLLVGTQRTPGQGIAAPRRTPAFALLPSWQGIALEPFSDTLTLTSTAGGFALAATDGLSLMPGAGADADSEAALLTRRYDFPALPPQALLQRLRTEMQSLAAAPPLARAPLRRLAAQTLIALGMGAEAQGLLDLAATDDPRAADDPDQIGLSAIAGVLAGRLKQTEGLDDPRLSDTDEIALWRAVRQVMLHRAEGEESSPEAAATFAATDKLALAYPAPLRARLLPLIAETMASSGETDAAKALLAKLPNEQEYALARAMLAQAQGQTAAALAGYDQITQSNDRLARARAGSRAVELRLATHALDAAGAAAAYERQLEFWRDDDREFALRLRLAELRAQAGEWRSAFALLRETATDYPDHPAVLERERALFANFLQGEGEHLSPLDFVAFVDENADLLPDGPAGDPLADRLAERLAQLDLPARAESLLQKLIDHAKTPLARAAFGARLAELRLADDDPGGARTALTATDAPDLPAPLAERRAMVAAHAAAHLGQTEAALAALAPFTSVAAMEARAHILEDVKDWPRALAALSALAGKTIPPEGALNATQRHLLLRLAAAASAAGDTATLATLRDQDLPRLGTGPDADMLRVLTEAPVTSVGDLARARSEEQSATSVAARMAQASGPAATQPEKPGAATAASAAPPSPAKPGP
jgi:hypothetical protein